ncbi:hypothetical protein P7C70_g4692, partial [Phenoliferia sp. Uapishka_3]
MLILPPHPGPAHLDQLFIDPTQSYSAQISNAGSARARLRSVLKATRRDAQSPNGADWTNAFKVLSRSAEWGAQAAANVGINNLRQRADFLALLALQATSEYLPYLHAILACVESDDLILRSEPVFSWRSALAAQVLRKSRPRIALPSLHYELSCLLLTHALCLSNRSATLVASLGSYETSASVSSAELKTHDETINSAAEMLCRSSGILSHLAEVVLPRWEAAVGEATKGRPVELQSDVVTALSKLALADANLLAIRRLLSRSLALSHTLTTPGPPLPKSHPSPSLLAKLHLKVYHLYDSARSLLKPYTSEISPDLRRYLSDGRLVAQSLSYKWLGVDAGENGTREKAGDSIAWLLMAKSGFDEVKGKTEGVGRLKVGKGKVGKESKGKLAQEAESVKAFLSAYKRVNDSLHFQPIPSAASLQLTVPSGIAALSAKLFTPPPPAFNPRPHDSTRPKIIPPPPPLDASFAGLNIDDDSSDEDEGPSAGGGNGDREYFGAGNYW